MESENFTEVEEVLRIDGVDTAAPVVSWANGRYMMVLSVSDGTSWSFATSWSYDGRAWATPEPFAAYDGAFDAMRPPRAAASTDVQGFFRVEGDDLERTSKATGAQVPRRDDGERAAGTGRSNSMTPRAHVLSRST